MSNDYSDNRVYTKRHIWAEPNMKDSTATVGITDFLTDELGSIDSLDLPMVGDELEMDTICIHLHINNRIHHLRTPLTGRCVEVNQDVLDNPSLIFLAPNENWLFKMEFDDPDELDTMMNGSQYSKYLDQL